MKALYADTGALAADERAENTPGVTKAGHKLASDAIAAVAGGDASSAVPQLEAGNAAITGFSAATGKCTGAKA